jgi:hypothetical protein
MIETLVFVLLVGAFGMLARTVPIGARSVASTIVAIVLGSGLALGAASCTLFLTGIAFDGLSAGARWLELGLLCVLAGAAFWATRPSGTRAPQSPEPPVQHEAARGTRSLALVLSLAFAAAAIMALADLVELTRERPYGEWDAWAIWNGRAAFLYQLTHDWPEAALAISRGHGSYPLLLSLSVARFWAYLGSAVAFVPQALAAFYLVALVALLVSALACLRSLCQGLLAGLLLLSAPYGVELASYLYADVPFAFQLLASCVLLVASDRASPARRPQILVAAGLALGLAAWTKNEGLALALVAVLAYGIATLASSGARAGELRALATGLLPIGCVIAFFKLALAPGDDLAALFRIETSFLHLAEVGRHTQVLHAYGTELHELAGGLVWALPVYAVIAGICRLGQRGQLGRLGQLGVGTWTALLCVIGLGVLTYLVYVATPHDLDWHLRTSCRRVLFQLFPSALFLLFLGLATPEEASRRAAR